MPSPLGFAVTDANRDFGTRRPVACAHQSAPHDQSAASNAGPKKKTVRVGGVHAGGGS